MQSFKQIMQEKTQDYSYSKMHLTNQDYRFYASLMLKLILLQLLSMVYTKRFCINSFVGGMALRSLSGGLSLTGARSMVQHCE